MFHVSGASGRVEEAAMAQSALSSLLVTRLSHQLPWGLKNDTIQEFAFRL